jgi:cell division protein FtsB
MISLADIPLADEISLYEEIEKLQATNQKLLTENVVLRKELKQAQMLITQLKFLLRRNM